MLTMPACMLELDRSPHDDTIIFEYGYCDSDYVPAEWTYIEYCIEYYDATCCLVEYEEGWYDSHPHYCEAEMCYYYDTCEWEPVSNSCYYY